MKRLALAAPLLALMLATGAASAQSTPLVGLSGASDRYVDRVAPDEDGTFTIYACAFGGLEGEPIGQPLRVIRWSVLQACCGAVMDLREVTYKPGPGATYDERQKKVRRRSSLSVLDAPSSRSLYKNLVNLVGDRWTANVIALSFHGLTRFDQFHQELPVATNRLADRLKFLVDEGVFRQSVYLQRPLRHEYCLTEKGEALYPWFLALLQWGDKWCNVADGGKPMQLTHEPCERALHGQVECSACGGVLKAHEVQFDLGQ